MNQPSISKLKITWAYVYLYLFFILIVTCFTYLVLDATGFFATFIYAFITLPFYFAYVIINHILFFKIVSHKFLANFDILLFLTLFIVFICDLTVDH